MTLLDPIWLLLAFPLGLAVWLWRVPGRGPQVLRVAVCVLLILAMAKLAMVLPGRGSTVVVVADRSASMPETAERTQRELIETLGDGMRPEDRLGVVAVGRATRIEQSPDHEPFAGFATEVGPDASNLAEAVEAALGLVPREGGGRVIVLSDGRWTGRDLSAAAGRAAGRGVGIDYRLIERPAVNDLAIARFDGPARVTPQQEYLLTADLRSPTRQQVRYELRRGDRVISSGQRELRPGRSRLRFRDRTSEPGTANYTLRIRGENDDPQLENNRARLLVGVEGRRPIMLVSDKADPALAAVLEAGGLNVSTTGPAGFSADLAELGGYAAVVIEDVPAHSIGRPALANLAEWVQHAGGGLWKTGGQRAFGAGGYFEGPLDPVLPVSMELRQEHRKHRVAVVVAMDRSGSMSMGTGGGRTKMDLANLGAARVLDMLTPMDEMGVIAVDTAPHVIVPITATTADAIEDIRSRVLRIQSTGGGIFVNRALTRSLEMLSQAQAGTRHLILFADASDSQEPGNYRELLQQANEAGITCSVVALGSENDVHAELLKDVADQGGGRAYFTTDAGALPELFAQDMEVVARRSFVEEQTPVAATSRMQGLMGRVPGDVPPIGGYSLTYLRDGAQLGMVSGDEYQAPIVAAWQAGLGRSVVYTGEADGAHTGPIAQWDEVGDLMTSLARWAAGDEADLGDQMVLTQSLDEGQLRVRLHLDPEADTPPLQSLPELTILRGQPGREPEAEQVTMEYVAVDALGYDVSLEGGETVIVSATVEPGNAAGEQVATLAPVTLPYPPEYAPVTTRRGAESLRQLARASGGAERLNMADVWTEMPRQPRLVDLSPYLLLIAAVVFLMEVFERRTGQLGRLALLLRRRPIRRAARTEAAAKATPTAEPVATPPATGRPAEPLGANARAAASRPGQGGAEPDRSASASDDRGAEGNGSGGGVFAALDDARRRARRRTDRRDS